MTPTEVERMAIIVLSITSALLFLRQGWWESALTRFLLFATYLFQYFKLVDAETVMFGVRWALLLLLFVEVLFPIIRGLAIKKLSKEQN